MSDDALLALADEYLAHEMRRKVGLREEVFRDWCRSRAIEGQPREALRLVLLGSGVRGIATVQPREA